MSGNTTNPHRTIQPASPPEYILVHDQYPRYQYEPLPTVDHPLVHCPPSHFTIIAAAQAGLSSRLFRALKALSRPSQSALSLRPPRGPADSANPNRRHNTMR